MNNNANPKVSVLMPVYKTADYLREAMDSMLSQTFTDFELIVLNDCSPDNAEEVLDTYTDPRIVRYRGVQNQGLANVLNVGMEIAKGKYIARMDSDDVSLPNRLETQIKYLEEHPEVDLCSCGMQLFGAKEGVWTRTCDPDKVKIEALYFSPILHASSVWRKESFDRHHLRFRQEMVPAEDYDLWCRALSCGLRLINIPDVLYHYRIRPGQASGNSQRTQEKEFLVRKDYFLTAFPCASIHVVNNYLCWNSCSLHTLRKTLLWMNITNITTRFFNTKRLFISLFKFHKQRQKNERGIPITQP